MFYAVTDVQAAAVELTEITISFHLKKRTPNAKLVGPPMLCKLQLNDRFPSAFWVQRLGQIVVVSGDRVDPQQDEGDMYRQYGDMLINVVIDTDRYS